jgi:putative PIG3 family NAD(P)H quinone oxidoreductase
MRAIVFDKPGDESVLHIADVPAPTCGPREIRIRNAATAVNRADILQREGHYPPPPGASTILGLECAGSIAEVGNEASGWSVGQRVMALLPGGGYAEEVVVDARSAITAPDRLSDVEAGALPEVYLTAYLNVFKLGHAREGETLLVHGGGSGVGTAALNLCRLVGVRVIVTAGSDDKCARCMELGAIDAINYKTEDFAARAREITGGRGVDLVLDNIGARYLQANLKALGVGGRLIEIGSMGGLRTAELDVSALLANRQQIIGSTLRSRSAAEKGSIVSGFLQQFGDALERGEIRPVIAKVFPFEEAAAAHRLMNSSEHFGKIALKVR